MRTRKGGNSSTGAKRPRLEPELEETSIVGNLMHHFAQKFEERMQKKRDMCDRTSTGASLASAKTVEMGNHATRNSEPDTSTKKPEVPIIRGSESSTSARPIKAVSKNQRHNIYL